MNSVLDTDIDKCILIKKLVQRLSGVANIGHKTRNRDYVHLRKIYCKLCQDFTLSSLRVIGKGLRKGYDHATVLHAIKTFDIHFELNQLNHVVIYHKAYKILTNPGDEIEEHVINERIVKELQHKIEMLENFISKQNY